MTKSDASATSCSAARPGPCSVHQHPARPGLRPLGLLPPLSPYGHGNSHFRPQPHLLQLPGPTPSSLSGGREEKVPAAPRPSQPRLSLCLGVARRHRAHEQACKPGLGVSEPYSVGAFQSPEPLSLSNPGLLSWASEQPHTPVSGSGSLGPGPPDVGSPLGRLALPFGAQARPGSELSGWAGNGARVLVPLARRASRRLLCPWAPLCSCLRHRLVGLHHALPCVQEQGALLPGPPPILSVGGGPWVAAALPLALLLAFSLGSLSRCSVDCSSIRCNLARSVEGELLSRSVVCLCCSFPLLLSPSREEGPDGDQTV